MDEKKMRESWQEVAGENRCETMLDPMLLATRRTALDELATRYRRFCILGFVMSIVSWFYAYIDLIPKGMRLTLCIYLSCYFLVAACMDFWLYNGIRSVNILTMSVEKVATKVLFYKKRHHQFMMVLIPLAVILFVLLWKAFSGDIFVEAAMICGGVIGLAIGITQYIRFMSDYKSLTE